MLLRLVMALDEGALLSRFSISLNEWLTQTLTDGEPFGCLEQSMMHPWVDFVISNIKLTYILLLCMRIPFFLLYSPVIATVKMVKEYIGSKKTLRDKVDRRLALENPRPDLVQVMLAERQGLVRHHALNRRLHKMADPINNLTVYVA